MDIQLARELYEAYCTRAGGKSLATGAPLPGWHQLPWQIQDAWEAVAAKARQELENDEGCEPCEGCGKCLKCKTCKGCEVCQ